MDNVIGIGIDYKSKADMFDTDPDTDSDPEKSFHVRSKLKLMTSIIKWQNTFLRNSAVPCSIFDIPSLLQALGNHAAGVAGIGTGYGALRANVARVGGPQSQDAESAAVVHLLQALGNHAVGVAGTGPRSGVLRPNPTLQKPEGTIAKAEKVKP